MGERMQGCILGQHPRIHNNVVFDVQSIDSYTSVILIVNKIIKIILLADNVDLSVIGYREDRRKHTMAKEELTVNCYCVDVVNFHKASFVYASMARDEDFDTFIMEWEVFLFTISLVAAGDVPLLDRILSYGGYKGPDGNISQLLYLTFSKIQFPIPRRKYF
ncbi:hypothetical protein BT96DRAFT_936602 [Gymnopus androsaceus JB14]|uniref:Uncharacterized protein n=1 Tax=Gymnopus androsaceus JB14 TaxID=1447944 RepID=A0A6A4I2Y7_9AGAR|nr:hypothetical protein BT96DRAFT_936602 [Gymnopus androsaceus JB14]